MNFKYFSQTKRGKPFVFDVSDTSGMVNSTSKQILISDNKSINNSSPKPIKPVKETNKVSHQQTEKVDAGLGASNYLNVNVTNLKVWEDWLPSQSMFRGDPNTLWIKITGQYVLRIKSNVRALNDKYENDSITYDDKRPMYIFHFLAPNEIIEPIQHEWAPYDSLASRVAQKAADFYRMGNELQGINIGEILDYLGSLYKAPIATVGNVAEKMVGMNLRSLSETGTTIGRKLQNADVALSRVDSPLVYKNSSRRSYEFVFQLFASGYSKDDNPFNKVVYPTKLLQFLSSAGMAGEEKMDNGQLKFIPALSEVISPCIFKIETEPAGLIDVKRAVIRSIQPVYKGPYVYGSPTSCELHVSFEEFDPLWDKNFFPNNLVTVGTTSEGTKKIIMDSDGIMG